MSDITNTGARFHLRVARPVSNLQRAQQMYCAGLGLEVIDGFENHEGFDGVMLGFRGCDYHLEFTYQDHDGYRVVLQRENWHGPGGIPLTD